ncbi:DNA uptake porin HofQ [Candidatus Fukatsuia symbiotica]|nr:DNA uptake porin HofQ [Candidatus Fukatsuia symbiotica]MEA9445235.1 DNA uptake porin HofQ [Candidatus Fukatsuia symbiotica]
MKFFLGLFLLAISNLTCLAAQQDISVNMEFQDTPVSVILQALADYQQLNLITTKEVSGNLNLRLIEVPWTQALAIILRVGRLRVEHEGNVMLVFTEQEITEREQQIAKIRNQQKIRQQPLDNLILTLQHADAEQLAESLSSSYGSLISDQGSIIADKRTNSLLIRDTPESLITLKAWLTEMDAPLQQVQLAAHIVTISSEDLHELGVRWGMKTEEGSSPLRINNFNVSLPLQNPALAAGFHVARISGRLLDLELSALEQEKQVDIIASPRLITSHQQTASIKQGTDIPYAVSSGTKGATTIEFKEAVLGMEVTPKIFRNGQITLKLKISQNVPGMAIKRGEGEAFAIDKQEIKTQITVKHGETIVLGGIFQQKNNQRVYKVPGLADIPLLGGLFKQDVQQQTRRELVIFITPKLISS